MHERILTNVRNALEGTSTRSDWNLLWHTAPQAARGSIISQGLIAAQGGGYGLEQFSGIRYPLATYLTSRPGHIGIRDHVPFENKPFESDIWEIDTTGLELQPDWPAVYEHGAHFEEDGSFWFESDALHDLMETGDEFHPDTIDDPIPWMALTGTCCYHGDITTERVQQIHIEKWLEHYGQIEESRL